MATVVITSAGSGDNTLVAAVTGKKIRVHGYELSASAAVNAKFRSGTTDLTGLIYLAAAGSSGTLTRSTATRTGCSRRSPGSALVLNLSAAVPVGGWVDFSLE
jgi:hypothetical protein